MADPCNWDDEVQRALAALREKSPGELAREGNAEQAQRTAEAEIQRGAYLVDKAETLSAEEADRLAKAGGATVSAATPTDWTARAAETPIELGFVAPSTVTRRKADWITSPYRPVREIFGAPVVQAVNNSVIKNQQFGERVGLTTIKILTDEELIPTSGTFIKRPRLSQADPDSLEKPIRQIIHDIGLTVIGKPALSRAEARAAAKLQPIVEQLLLQVHHDDPVDWVLNYLANGQSLEAPAFMHALTREVGNTHIINPQILAVSPYVGQDGPTRALFKRWTEILRGKPLPIEKTLVNTIQGLHDWASSIPIAGRAFRQVKMHDRAALQLSQMVTDTFYMGALGFRPRSAIQNLLQQNLSMNEIGAKYVMLGWKRGMTAGKAEYARLQSLGIFHAPAHALETELAQFTTGNLHSDMARYALAFFRGTDTANRFVTYIGAEQKFLDFARAGGAEKLINGKFLTTGARTDIRPSLSRLVKLGEYEKAARIYATDVTNNTQFLFGKANTPIGMQSPMWRVFGQFSQWPLNYWNFMHSLAEPGRYSGLAKHFAATAGMLYLGGKFLDVNLVNWIGAGALPSEIGVTGPMGRIVIAGLGAGVSGAKVMQAQLGGNDKEASTKFAKIQFKQATNELGRIAGLAIPGGSMMRDIYGMNPTMLGKSGPVQGAAQWLTGVKPTHKPKSVGTLIAPLKE